MPTLALSDVRAAWPDVGAAAPALEALDLDAEPAHRADVLLAWACVLASPTALDQLERDAVAPAARHLASRGFAAHVVDEAVQAARVRLIIGTGDGAPAFTTYRGRGPLAAFVRTTVARLAVDLARDGATIAEPTLDHLVDDQPDPELAYLRAHYADALARALTAAWAALPRHERFVLTLALHHRLGSDEIARIYGSHRATAARKLAAARAALHAGLRLALRDQLAVGDPTVDSILRVVTTSQRWQALAPMVAEGVE